MNSLSRTALAAGLSLALAGAASAANQVLVVDDVAGPGVDFTSLQSAINAATQGDVILIRAGSYFATGGTIPTFQINGKSLTLAADGAAVVNLTSPLSVGGLVAGQQVALRGLRIQVVDSGTALSLFSNAGSVWVEDCTLSSSVNFFPMTPAGNGALASSCSSLVFARCSLTGSTITTSLGPGYDGYLGTSSNACFYDCTLVGGNASNGSPLLVGGDGAHLAGGFLFASGTTFRGGKGGNGSPAGPFTPCATAANGAPGGDGIHLASGAPLASTVACTFLPGPGGASGGGSCTAGAAGQSVNVEAGTHTPLAGPAHHLTVTAVVREGQVLTKTYSGPSGELAFADYGGALGFTYFEAFRGVLVLSLLSPFITTFEGTIPPSGTLVKTVTINPLAPGTEGIPVYLQGGFFDFSTGIFQGAPSMTVLLDAAF